MVAGVDPLPTRDFSSLLQLAAARPRYLARSLSKSSGQRQNRTAKDPYPGRQFTARVVAEELVVRRTTINAGLNRASAAAEVPPLLRSIRQPRLHAC